MRAAAILGVGCSLEDLQPFRTETSVEWIMGIPSSADHVEVVVLFGGDGTIHRHLVELVRLGVPALVVPAGSGNDFARALGFRRVRDSIEAWKRFCAGEGNVRVIDLGVISSVAAHDERTPTLRAPTFFCSVAGIGLDSEVSRRANDLPRWLRGHGGYVLSLLPAALVHFAPQQMKISTRGGSGEWTICSDQSTFLSAFANTDTYGGGMRIAPQARIDDGRLDVCIVSGMDPLKLLCMFPSVYFGRHLGIREVSSFKATCVRVETDRPLDVHADGEYVCRTPVEIAVRSAALRVIVHPSSKVRG